MKAISRLLGRNWKLALGQRPVDPTFDSTRSCREFVFHVKNLNWKRRKKGQVSPLSGYREKVYNLKRGSLSSSTWWPILLSSYLSRGKYSPSFKVNFGGSLKMSDKSIDLVGKKIYLLHRIVQGKCLIFDIC